MEQRRPLLFMALSTSIIIAWLVVAPLLFPPPAKKPVVDNNAPAAQAVDKIEQAEGAEPLLEKPAPANLEDPGQPDEVAATEQAPAEAEVDEQPKEEQFAALPESPTKTVLLGSLDPKSTFAMRVSVTTRGAVVTGIELNDKRYRELTKPDTPLKIVGNDTATDLKTFELSIPELDSKLKEFGTNLADVNWELVSESSSEAVFRYRLPDGTVEIERRYQLGEGNPEERDDDPASYLLKMELVFRNLGQKEQSLTYQFEGPVGLPLENVENTRKYRDIKLGFLDDDGAIRKETVTASTVAKEEAAQELEQWKRPMKFIGVDVQYFAAIILLGGNQLESPYISVAEPVLISRDAKATLSDIGVLLTSRTLDLPPGEDVVHSYTLFAGPKRAHLLDKAGLSKVLDFGWFGNISLGMLWLLNVFHTYLYLPYGFAIILLTLLVRACLFPLSMKQTVGAKKMKELQPKIAELKKKYGKDKEKFARAQMELFSKHNYNPLTGCLPMVLQFPVFIGLYQALNNSVDLRMAPFLWADNLAAPDAMFQLPFAIPFLGSTFNLLPIITIALFIVNQKMFMPPAVDKEQEMQQKMMSYMMVAMGFMFYRVPAGLCVYFIASSLFGILERKLLDFWKSSPSEPKAADDDAVTKDKDKPEKKERVSILGTFWDRIATSAEANETIRKSSNGAAVATKRPEKKKKRRPSR